MLPVRNNEAMPTQVPVAGELLTWARERSRTPAAALAKKFPKFPQWEQETAHPTLRQLESFAQATRTPVGYFFLSQPPALPLPIPDFRTRSNDEILEPSPDLLDTIYACQQRQEWYRAFAIATGEGTVAAVAVVQPGADITATVARMRADLRFETDRRGASWGEAFRILVDSAEGAGILVMTSGIVGSNTHRVLDPDEFGGFSLVDDYAPIVFINGADTKAAQIFTLAHELAHIYSGQQGVDDSTPHAHAGIDVERWCSAIAAEFLVPAAELTTADAANLEAQALDALAARFRVSTLVVLIRLRDAGLVTNDRFRTAYDAELERVRRLAAERTSSTGGNYYNTQPARTSKRFARALIADTLEGNTLYRDAFRMLGLKKQSTFDKLAEHLQVA